MTSTKNATERNRVTSKKSSKSTVIRNSRLVKFDFIFITNESSLIDKLVIFQ